MKKLSTLLAIIILISFNSCKSQIDFNKIKKEGTKILNQGGSAALTNDEIIKGLKEALTIGSKNASGLVSKVDGYYKNPQLYIPFPPEAKKVQETLVKYGQNKLVNDFVMTLNRAAEDAAKEAAPIFIAAVKNMTIKDGLNILNGNNDAATMYLKNNTQAELLKKFKPVIENSLNKVNATKYWTDVIGTYNKIPTVQKMNPDLATYATQKAIDGLFIVVAQEELKIRKDPAARVTDILKKVFGK
jgi:uncharacterized protein (UPF0333 family)